MTITLNGETRDIEPGTTVADLNRQLNLEGRAVAVEINGEIVPKREHESRVITDGDRIEMVTLVGGG